MSKPEAWNAESAWAKWCSTKTSSGPLPEAASGPKRAAYISWRSESCHSRKRGMSQPMATTSMSRQVMPAVSRQKRAASGGKVPSGCLTWVKRSSSTIAQMRPSPSTSAAELS